MEIINSDLTVIGGGIAGICCAVTAARLGLSVSLINDRSVLGGNASSEIRVNICGAAYNGRSPSVYAREGGIIEEIKLMLLHYGGGHSTPAIYDSVFFDLVYNEQNIALFLDTVAYDAQCEDDRITGVKCRQLASEREFLFVSPIVSDCSGDGTVAYKAGAEFMYGREAEMDFGESLAPLRADDYTLGNTLLFNSVDAGRIISYVKPDFAHEFQKLPFFKNINKKGLNRTIYRSGKLIHGHWWMEYGGQLDTIYDNEAISLELRKLVYGFWDYIKNSGDFEDVETLALDYVCPLPGKRESRRFTGPHVLTQNDIADKTPFYDAVACGGWPMDIHAPRGIYDDAPATEWNFVPGSYNIPFRCLYSKNISNLLFAGRNISATHVAFGSTRVMATGGCIGQAVGTAAFLCKKYGTTPDGILACHIEELQRELLRGDQTIIGFADNEENHLVRNATVRASSEKEYASETPQGYLPLDADYCISLPFVTDWCDAIEICVKNLSDKAQSLSVIICGGLRKENYFPEQIVKKISIPIAGGFEGWVKLQADCAIPADCKLCFELCRNCELEVCWTDLLLSGVETFVHNSDALRHEIEELPQYERLDKLICFRNVYPNQAVFAPENVLNPYSRPYGTPNLWISQGDGDGEYLEFTWKNPEYLHEAHIVFNSDLKGEFPAVPIRSLVKDYNVEFTDETGLVHQKTIRNNYLRINRISVKNRITQLKFVFNTTYGGKHFEVFSVKLYAD